VFELGCEMARTVEIKFKKGAQRAHRQAAQRGAHPPSLLLLLSLPLALLPLFPLHSHSPPLDPTVRDSSPSARSQRSLFPLSSAWLIQTLNFCSGTEKSHKHRSISMQSQIKSTLSNRLQHLPLRLPSVAFPSSTSRMSFTLSPPDPHAGTLPPL
jgi:hypothetical protein